MRYLSIAVAAFGLLTVGEAKCKPRPSNTLATNTPASSATPTSTPGPDAADYYIDNPNFSLGLAYYTPSGNVSWVGDDGYDGDGSSKDGTCELTTNGNDDDNTEASPVQKRDLTVTSISASVKNLVANSPYTISFHYLILTAKPDNSCRLRAYFNGNNFANTDRFPLTRTPSTSWSLLSGTVIPSSTTGTFTISLNCNAPGFAVAYVDSLRVVKGAAVVSSTAAQVSSSSSSVVASLSTPVSSGTGAAISSTTPVSSNASSSQASSTTPASASSTPSSSTGSSADSTTPAVSPSSAASSSSTPASSPASSTNTPSSTQVASTTVSSSTPAASSTAASSTPVSSSAASSTTPVASSTASSTPVDSSTASSGTPSSAPGSSSTPYYAFKHLRGLQYHSFKHLRGLQHYTLEYLGGFQHIAFQHVGGFQHYSLKRVGGFQHYALEHVGGFHHYTLEYLGGFQHNAFQHVGGFQHHSFQHVGGLQHYSLKHVGGFQHYALDTTPSSTPSSTSSSSASSTAPVSTPSSTSTPSATPTSSTLPSATVDSTVLILAKDAATAKLASDGLNAYGIPFQSFIVAQAGSTLPVLNSSSTSGNYGGIIVMSSVSYDYGGTTGWQSAITTDQWTLLNNYQLNFNVRMVRIDEYPGASFGTTPGADGGCCTSPVTQNISFSDTSDFPTAQLKVNAKVGTDGLYHVPATITDSSTTRAVAVFTPDSGSTVGGVAAVINNFNGREQFVWFISWATDWSQTTNWLQHAHIHWMTRGVFVGKRKVHLNDQVDDLQLSTEMFYPQNIPEVKIGVTDLEAHVDWQTSINARLPTGSDFWLELGHNGNGDIINSTLTDDDMNTNKCNPVDAVYWEQDVQAPNEWRKPLGTGDDVWPTGTKYETYSWSLTCAKIDQFAVWFTKSANLNHFAHLSHTFSHMSLNNATYHDAKREIQFNQAWLKQMGIDKATRYTGNGIIPPAITGLNNGDSIQALMDNGIKHVVGDNTRPATRNPNSVYWPLISTYATNGYDGLTIIPRFASRIYFNCHTPDCTTREWIQTSAGSGDFNTLLAIEKTSSTRNLLALQSDPYMFHQANMYTTGNDIRTIGDQTRRMSLIMAWTETIVQEMVRLTNWPMTSQTQDQMATYFLNRMTLDACNPKLSYVWSDNGKTLQKVIVTADGNTCATPIPVTIPKGSVTASGGSVTSDVVGAEPPIQWVTLNGAPVTLTLSTAVTATTATSS
ncbi:unnamed protein product [Clonostachys solani]|uniref:Extracellular serine-rich protein n=1 Tax=Clonostachys solani TaxID=160281 RepID=A0A9N9ZKG2_9HYPO|nr:unnamed protein product [Clonostachys solani]